MKNNIDNLIAKLIQLNEAGLRVKRIAKYFDISTASVSCWLTGVSRPSKKRIGKVEKLINRYAWMIAA
jgi:predicted transcriptional regulator